jgi:hypothetical protein
MKYKAEKEADLLKNVPEMENYMHLLKWANTVVGDFYHTTTDIPEHIRDKVAEYQKTLRPPRKSNG